MSILKSVKVFAPSKINLFLKIHGLTENNYHELSSVMQTTSLGNYITITRGSHKEIKVSSSKGELPPKEESIAYRCAESFFVNTKIENTGIDIHIDEFVPPESGLGGGSGDGAGVLVGLNRMFSGGLSLNKLAEIGSKIGADIPFCVVGGSALAQGIGEKLTPLKKLTHSQCVFLIIKPKGGVSTPEAFQLYDSMEKPAKQGNLDAMLKAWESHNLAEIGKEMYNVFESALNLADTAKLKETMIKHGALGSALSGSGSSVVGMFTSITQAERCAKEVKDSYSDIFIVHPVTMGATVVESN